MTRLAWERYEGNDVEAVVAMLINRERPTSVRITPSRGDGGVDILDRGAGASGGDVVYQVKRYATPLSANERTNVEKSLTRLRSDPRWASLRLEEWRLVTPWDPTPEADAWLQGLGDGTHAVVWHGLTFVDTLSAKYPEVIDYYLEGGKSRIEEAYRSVLSLLAPPDTTQSFDVPSVSSRLANAIAVLDGDPHYRYEVRLGEGELPEPVERPNLMMTYVQSDGPGKKWQAVDVIARCAASATERPITISGTLTAERGSALATALQDFLDYGAPFATPVGAFSGALDAPGGLGGALTNAAVQVLPIDDEVGSDADLLLETRSPAGERIAETEVTRVERSEGVKGLRVVLQQKNKVFTIEDRYTPAAGGKREFQFGDYSTQPALDVQSALAFVASAASPNTVYVRRKGAPARSASIDPNWNISFPREVDEVLTAIRVPVDDLARLQEHTGTVIRVPDLTEITFAQAAEWRRVAMLLEGQEVFVTYPTGHALGIETAVELDTIPDRLGVEVPLEATVGPQVISFGTAFMWLEAATLVESREVGGRKVHWLTTPDRRIRFTLTNESQEEPGPEHDPTAAP